MRTWKYEQYFENIIKRESINEIDAITLLEEFEWTMRILNGM